MSMDNLLNLGYARIGYLGTISSATTTNGNAIDRRGYGDLLVIVQTGTVAGSGLGAVVSVQMDTVSGFSSATAITGAAFSSLDEDDDDTIRVGRVNLRGAEQYIRPSIVTTGTVTSLPITVTFLLGMAGRSLASGVGYTADEYGFDVQA